MRQSPRVDELTHKKKESENSSDPKNLRKKFLNLSGIVPNTSSPLRHSTFMNKNHSKASKVVGLFPFVMCLCILTCACHYWSSVAPSCHDSDFCYCFSDNSLPIVVGRIPPQPGLGPGPKSCCRRDRERSSTS